MKTITSTSKLRGVLSLMFGGALAFALMSQPASADTLHGYCFGTACPDNGTNSETTVNPPSFTFSGSGQDVTGVLYLDFLVPVGDGAAPSSISVTGATAGTASLVNSTPWTTGQLDSYLGISGSPTNSIGGYTAGNVNSDGFYVFQVDLGTQTLGGTSDPSAGPEETVTGGLPLDSYIVAFLDTNDVNRKGVDVFSATANSGAIFVDGPPKVTPEPSSLALLGTGALGFAGVLRRKFRRS